MDHDLARKLHEKNSGSLPERTVHVHSEETELADDGFRRISVTVGGGRDVSVNG